jgi:hypothetical protein
MLIAHAAGFARLSRSAANCLVEHYSRVPAVAIRDPASEVGGVISSRFFVAACEIPERNGIAAGVNRDRPQPAGVERSFR